MCCACSVISEYTDDWRAFPTMPFSTVAEHISRGDIPEVSLSGEDKNQSCDHTTLRFQNRSHSVLSISPTVRWWRHKKPAFKQKNVSSPCVCTVKILALRFQRSANQKKWNVSIPYTLESNFAESDISMDKAKINVKLLTKNFAKFPPYWAWAVRTEVLEYDGSRQAFDLFLKYLFKQLIGKWKRKLAIFHEKQFLEQVEVFVDLQIINEVSHDCGVYQRYPGKFSRQLL